MTWGNFLAVQIMFAPSVSGRDRSFILLVRVTDWKMRIVERAPMDRFGEGSFALSSKYLYTVPEEFGDQYGPLADSVFRYDLSSFDSIGDPLILAP